MLKTQTTNITTTAAATNGNEKPKNTKNKNIYETETKTRKKKLKTRLNLKRNLVTFFPSLATPLLRCFSSLIDVPVYTHVAWRRERAAVGADDAQHSKQMQGSNNNNNNGSGTHSRERQMAASARARSLSLSTQRNVDHFCFQYEIIDSAVDSDSGSETKRERTNKFAPTNSPRPPASLSEMERGERS